MKTSVKARFADAPTLTCLHFECDPDCVDCWRLVTYLYQFHGLDSWDDSDRWKAAWFAAKDIPVGPAARRYVIASASPEERNKIEQWKKEWRRLKSVVCYWCQSRLSPKRCEADHLIPIAKGGEHSLANHVIACASCNRRKQAKMPDVFAAEMAGT